MWRASNSLFGDGPGQQIEPHEENPYRQLLIAALVQTVDSLSAPVFVREMGVGWLSVWNAQEYVHAFRWITSDSRGWVLDYDEVCRELGYQPDVLRVKARAIDKQREVIMADALAGNLTDRVTWATDKSAKPNDRFGTIRIAMSADGNSVSVGERRKSHRHW